MPVFRFGRDRDTGQGGIGHADERSGAGDMQRSEKRREISRLKAELRDLEPGLDRSNQKRHKKREIFELKSGPDTTGSLPHFVIIGTQKGGTTSLYRLLAQHPLSSPPPPKRSISSTISSTKAWNGIGDASQSPSSKMATKP